MEFMGRMRKRRSDRLIGEWMEARAQRLLLAQHDQNIANASGATVRADINNALAALFTNSSGASAPATTIAYMLWADTTLGLLKLRNAANSAWITVGTLASYALGLLGNSMISGLTYQNSAGDATNDITIAAGRALDGTNAYLLTLSATLTKQLDAAWAVGNNAGGLDTGTIGNSDYYIWLIARADTGVVDALFSLSSTAPTMPTNYDFKRLIGWFKRVGGTIVAFTTYETEGGGLELLWTVSTADIDLSNTLTTSRRTDAIKVPLNFSVLARLNVTIFDATSGCLAWICSPDHTDAAPSGSSPPYANIAVEIAGNQQFQEIRIRTNSTGTIAARASIATVDIYRAATMGFTWARR